jgi:hypothetical protein
LFAAVSVALAADDEYRPSEFLTLDLSQAVLSPKRLGPPAEFAPVAVQAETESASVARNDHASEPYWAREELDLEPKKVEPKKVGVEDVELTHPHMVVHEAPKTAAQLKPKGAARKKLTHRHDNPFEAQARDTRIQKWPCRSGGGICGWR